MKVTQHFNDSIEQLKDTEIALKLELARILSDAGSPVGVRRLLRKKIARVLTAVNCRSSFNSEVV